MVWQVLRRSLVSVAILGAIFGGTGLVALCGSNPDPSVVGLLLGGGVSWFTRKHGFVANSVVAFDVVDPAGAVRHVTETTDPDLFWALRGGGGDFAVVVAAELQLFDEPDLYAGRLLWPVEHAGPVQVLGEGGRATGVATAAGERFDADAVLLATGPSVPEQLAELGVTMPDATPAALLVKTRPAGTELRAVLNTPYVSLRPTPDGGLAMDSDAAAEEVIGDERSGYEVKDTTVEDLMAHASAILAGHPRLEAEWYGVGRKPIPGDGDPVFGPVDEVPGLSVAFSHSGATLALISGELLAREIVTGVASPLLAAFRPSRFR